MEGDFLKLKDIIVKQQKEDKDRTEGQPSLLPADVSSCS